MTRPPRLLCIGTHHKSGTVWMRRTFHEISRRQGIPMGPCYRAERLAELDPGPNILVNWSSTFPKAVLDHPEVRMLHVVRDPRDMLISAMRYHLKAPLANEKFLAETRPEWGGRSYRDQLRHLATDAERLHFEMGLKFRHVMRQLARFPRGHPNVVELRYEDLIADTEAAGFRAALERAAPPALDIDDAVAQFVRFALFGGLKDPAKRRGLDSVHIRSGAPGQWRRAMPRAVARAFAAEHGPLLARYAYAPDDTWVEACRADPAAA